MGGCPPCRSVMGTVHALHNMDDDEIFSYAKQIAARMTW